MAHELSHGGSPLGRFEDLVRSRLKKESAPMNRHTRRSVLRTTAGLVAGLACPSILRARESSDRLRYAAFGIGGKGAVDLASTAEDSLVDVVALCDIDSKSLDKARALHPAAKAYSDWRELLDGERIDIATVTTPDHMHAPIAFSAMQRGVHVYCQKPLTRTISEARALERLAADKKLVTQMGIQVRNYGSQKAAVETFRSGVIGKVQEVWCWTDRPRGRWEQGGRRPKSQGLAPKHVAWDLWLGVAPARPWVDEVYHPFRWRGWEDFGTGSIGDMACHMFDPVMEALELGAPLSVRSHGSDRPNGETYPLHSDVEYVFAGNAHTTGERLSLRWLDNAKKPPFDRLGFDTEGDVPDNGSVLVGEHGSLLMGYKSKARLLGVKGDIPRRPTTSHYLEWTEAVRGKGKTTTPFSYSAPLTETVLLGNVAVRYPGRELRWDSKALRFVGASEADRWIRPTYREGWKIAGLG